LLEPIFGRTSLDALFHELEISGVTLSNTHGSYSLAQIQITQEEIFGSEATILILRHISQKLFE
jgi:hypothetical protein